MRTGLLAAVCALTIFTARPAAADGLLASNDEIASLSAANVVHHYQSEAITRYLREAGPDERAAAEFLLAWLPPSDLGALPAELLIENVELALDAWRDAPWRDEIDPYTFRAYVLPHRVSQEPVQRWRGELRTLVAPRIEGMDLAQAALEVNRFCREWATYTPTSGRDQGPLTTMERGLGRCEEEMILAICALRSVGIPARACSVPCWCTGDGNHAWTEVYTGREGGWRYLGACEPAACLDQAWFTEIASRTGIVLSVGYGEAAVPAEHAARLYRRADGVTILNSIDVYSDSGTLVATLPETAGNPDDVDIHVHTFNWGGLVPIARTKPGEAILLGPGDYVLTAESAGEPASALATIRGGATTAVALEPGLPVLDRPVWLRYPPAGERRSEDCRIEEDDPVWLRHQREIARRELERCEDSKPSPAWIAFLAGLPDAPTIAERMDWAGPTQDEWTATLVELDEPLLEPALALIAEMDLKDFFEMEPSAFEDAVRAASEVRALVGADVPDSTWYAHVLPARLYRQEGTMRWWTELPRAGRAGHPPDPEAVLALFRERVARSEATYMGHVAAPEETWRAGSASPTSARACLVALLRTHGIPARAGMGVPYVEAWTDSEWRRLVPFAEDEAAGETPGESPTVGSGYLAARYSDRGRSVDEIETWRQTRLTRFTDGAFMSWYLGQTSEGGGLVEWTLDPGDYWLFGGLRNPSGEPRFVARPVTIAGGDSITIDLDIGIPLEEWNPEDLVVREWDPPAEAAVSLDGKRVALADLARGGTLLAITLAGHEASTRQLLALESMDWDALGLEFVSVRLAGLADHEPEPGAITIDETVAAEALGVRSPTRDLPLTIALDASGRTLLWLRGMRLDTADYLRGILAGTR